MFLLKKWPHRLLLLPKSKSDPGCASSFSQIFDSGSGSGSERKTQNPTGVDAGNLDPVPPLVFGSEMITIRFAGWISGRIVSLQPDKDIQNCFQTGTGYGSGYPKRFYQYFEDSDFWKKMHIHIEQSFIYYLQKHVFSLLRHDSESVYGVISEA